MYNAFLEAAKSSISSRDYGAASPFSHAVVSDLFDSEVLNQIESSFPKQSAVGWRAFENDREAKRGFTTDLEVSEPIRAFLSFLNSFKCIEYLEELTGIDGLIPDPWFGGGGLHRIDRGGFLDVHVDFNFHPKLRLYRRLNMLVYLNRGWKEEWGGQLQLCAPDGTVVKSVNPEFNTTVVFSTGETSFHGHPVPISRDAGMARRSVSTYYYTAEPPSDFSGVHDTLFLDRT